MTFCEHSNELSGYMKGEGFLEYMRGRADKSLALLRKQ
jgi:hypothetical protein